MPETQSISYKQILDSIFYRWIEKLKPSEILILLFLVKVTGDINTQSIDVSIRKLALSLNMAQTTVIRGLRNLENQELLVKTKQSNGKINLENSYQLNLDKLVEKEGGEV